MFDFLKDFGAKTGTKFESVVDLPRGHRVRRRQRQGAGEARRGHGIKVLEKITYKAQTTSLSSEVQRLKAANADVLLPSSYTSDTFLLLRTAKELDYNPKLIVAQNAGFTDPTFITTMGKDAEGSITRSPYNSDLEGRIPLLSKVNAIFKKHSNGRDLSDVPARVFTGFMTLLDAINRAGSTDPEKLRAALAATDIPPDQLIVPYKGVKFDASGQNDPGAADPHAGAEGPVLHDLSLRACRLPGAVPDAHLGRQGEAVSTTSPLSPLAGRGLG